MFWHLILVLLSPVYLMFALLFRDDRARLVLALVQQVLVLQRELGRRPSLVKAERLALVLSGVLRNNSSAPLTGFRGLVRVFRI